MGNCVDSNDLQCKDCLQRHAGRFGEAAISRIMSIAATSEISVACSDEMYTNEWIFPRGTTAWGFYVAGFSDVTDELKAIATQRCTGLGLTNQHTYYNPFTGASRRDEVRLCIQLLGPGMTLFYIEQNPRRP